MSSTRRARKELGTRAEALVCEHLIARGFAILGRNVRVGPKELDIIATRPGLIVFCEVRARMRSDFGSPLASFDRTKTQRVRQAARQWLYENGIRRVAVRFDAAAVVYDTPEGELEYVENAF